MSRLTLLFASVSVTGVVLNYATNAGTGRAGGHVFPVAQTVTLITRDVIRRD